MKPLTFERVRVYQLNRQPEKSWKKVHVDIGVSVIANTGESHLRNDGGVIISWAAV